MNIYKGREILVKDSPRSNMWVRIISSLFIGPIFILAIMWIPPLFYLLMFAVMLGMLYEWYDITHTSYHDLLIGIIIIPVAGASLLLLYSQSKNPWLILWCFAMIWSVDIFAMIGGKKIGGPKLARRLSPNKTWSGLLTGMMASGITALCLSKIPGFYIDNHFFTSKTHLVIISCLLALIAQVSDLLVSYFKRKFAVKDSGTLIPGHGGVLDRFDSVILTAPILFLIINYGCFEV